MRGRLLLCAPASGCGKTTVTCALLQALVNRGVPTVAFKSGPDYIDPMFHREVMGTPSRNLDLFLMGEAGVLVSLRENGRGRVSILEGAMGYYDGIAMSSRASAYDLARKTQTPAVLILDARGSALSAAALASGFRDFRLDSNIQGVILNRVSPMVYPRLKGAIEAETGLRVYGFLPICPEATLDSRHLGLVTAPEVANFREKLAALARAAEDSLDIDGLLTLAASAPELPSPEEPLPVPVAGKPRIALARDKAFCFYYEDALGLLERLGAELVPFSPLEDPALPEGIGGLYLGGGYPELHGEALEANAGMRQSVWEAISAGLPTIAECGGFLYLHEALEDNCGVLRSMAGVIPGRALRTQRLQQFGYVKLTAREAGLLCPAGEAIPAHEFHYWKSENPGEAFLGEKPLSQRHWDCGHHTPSLYAGFPHMHLAGAPQAARRFVERCGAYQRRQNP